MFDLPLKPPTLAELKEMIDKFFDSPIKPAFDVYINEEAVNNEEHKYLLEKYGDIEVLNGMALCKYERPGCPKIFIMSKEAMTVDEDGNRTMIYQLPASFTATKEQEIKLLQMEKPRKEDEC